MCLQWVSRPKAAVTTSTQRHRRSLLLLRCRLCPREPPCNAQSQLKPDHALQSGGARVRRLQTVPRGHTRHWWCTLDPCCAGISAHKTAPVVGHRDVVGCSPCCQIPAGCDLGRCPGPCLGTHSRPADPGPCTMRRQAVVATAARCLPPCSQEQGVRVPICCSSLP